MISPIVDISEFLADLWTFGKNLEQKIILFGNVYQLAFIWFESIDNFILYRIAAILNLDCTDKKDCLKLQSSKYFCYNILSSVNLMESVADVGQNYISEYNVKF